MQWLQFWKSKIKQLQDLLLAYSWSENQKSTLFSASAQWRLFDFFIDDKDRLEFIESVSRRKRTARFGATNRRVGDPIEGTLRFPVLTFRNLSWEWRDELGRRAVSLSFVAQIHEQLGVFPTDAATFSNRMKRDSVPYREKNKKNMHSFRLFKISRFMRFENAASLTSGLSSIRASTFLPTCTSSTTRFQ